MKKFIDANILLESLLSREKISEVRKFLAAEEEELVISPLSVHLCYHFCKPAKVRPEKIADFLNSFEVLAMDSYVIALAQKRYDGKDFEDCLQAATAEIGGCGEIITLDKNFKTRNRTKLKVTVL